MLLSINKLNHMSKKGILKCHPCSGDVSKFLSVLLILCCFFPVGYAGFLMVILLFW